MIGISTLTSNISGDIVIYEDPTSEIFDLQPRVSRSATLDGGAVITHSGFSHGDRTFRIKSEQIGSSDSTKLKAIVESATVVYAAAEDGFYSAAIERLKIDNGKLDMSILLKEKLSS